MHLLYGGVNNVVCWRPVFKTFPVCVFVLLKVVFLSKTMPMAWIVFGVKIRVLGSTNVIVPARKGPQ